MKPIHIFSFVVAVLMVLLAIAFYYPSEGIKLGNINLHFPSAQDLLFKQDSIVKYADITPIISQVEMALEKPNNETETQKDSLEFKENKPETDTIDFIDAPEVKKVQSKTLKKYIHPIEFPDKKGDALHAFFFKLNKLKEDPGHLIRIMHYGDSQIEVDRMTSFIRQRFQEEFGGNGPGLMHVVSPYNGHLSVDQSNEGWWHRYTIFGKIDKNVPHRRYGMMASFSTLQDYQSKHKNGFSGSVEFASSPLSYSLTKTYNQCVAYLGHHKKPVYYEIFAQGELLDADFIEPVNGLFALRYHFKNPVSEVKLAFSGESTPEFYGIALDGQSGIAVDNIALRGSSGLIFTRIDKNHLKKCYADLNPALVILQFGGNMVPYLDKNFSFYERRFYEQLVLLKEILPDASILVIGPADMSIKKGNYYVTAPNLKPIKQAMKKAAFKAGVAFWDMFEAMGGENSMPSWVQANPSLASGDYVHFNHRGARIMGEMIYNAVMDEYKDFNEAKR